jgi:hypothetical protein
MASLTPQSQVNRRHGMLTARLRDEKAIAVDTSALPDNHVRIDAGNRSQFLKWLRTCPSRDRPVPRQFPIRRTRSYFYLNGQAEWTCKAEAGAVQIASRTVSLLGATILSFEGQENGTLSLAFSDGQRLTNLNSSKEYQSYDSTRPGVTIVFQCFVGCAFCDLPNF